MIFPKFRLETDPGTGSPQEAEQKPFRALWAAVLLQAARDLERLPSQAKTPSERDRIALDRSQAEAWVRSDGRHDQSFLWCCAVCGVSPDALRQKLLGHGFRLCIRNMRYRKRRRNIEPRTLNGRTSNIELRTSNVE